MVNSLRVVDAKANAAENNVRKERGKANTTMTIRGKVDAGGFHTLKKQKTSQSETGKTHRAFGRYLSGLFEASSMVPFLSALGTVAVSGFPTVSGRGQSNGSCR
jgi:hypothetical protein